MRGDEPELDGGCGGGGGLNDDDDDGGGDESKLTETTTGSLFTPFEPSPELCNALLMSTAPNPPKRGPGVGGTFEPAARSLLISTLGPTAPAPVC